MVKIEYCLEVVNMSQLYIRIRVADYSSWRPVYDSLNDLKSSRGLKGSKVFQNSADSNEIIILEEWTSTETARGWAQSTEIREAMQRAGVVSKPIFLFPEEA